jgi:hypothetical protein
MVSAHAVDGNFDCHLSGWTADSRSAGGSVSAAHGKKPDRVGEMENDGVRGCKRETMRACDTGHAK